MKRQKGIGLVAAIAVLVVLTGIAAAVVSLGTAQQTTSGQDILSARAWQAAKAGNEWGLYQALQNNACAKSTLDLRADTGFTVTVSCTTRQFREGENNSAPGLARTVTLFRIESVACNAATCPSNDPATIASPFYVERTRVVLAGGG